MGGMTWTIAGSLTVVPAPTRTDLLAEPVAKALAALADPDAVGVTEIDPSLADTAAFCEAYGSSLEASANCVVVAGKRAGEVRFAGGLVLPPTRADVTGGIKARVH